MIKILTCIFLLGCVTYGAKHPRLVNAPKVTRGEHLNVYRFVVKIWICNKVKCEMCTGSLVKKNLVVTAAHCFCNVPSIDVIYVMADIESKFDPQDGIVKKGFRIDAAHLPNACNDPTDISKLVFGNDVALIFLHEPFDGIPPVKMYCDTGLDVMRVFMIGYGMDDNGTFGTLRAGEAQSGQCSYNWLGKPLCVKRDKSSPAIRVGDSGGPLLIRYNGDYQIIGVAKRYISASLNKKGGFETSLYTNIRDLCAWIRHSSAVAMISSVLHVWIQPFVLFVVLYF